MITLPALFENILQKVPALDAAVRKNLELFEPWLEQSGMPFFPGFTDHSPRHIRDVLETAASLVSDLSRDLLSAEDITVLCMSILLHDCGMHLTQDGFRAIVSNAEPAVISGLRDRPWQQLWNDFLGEASRFGEEKLVAIFGDSEPLRIDQLRLDDLSERDCLLIGEFVRRHHARLAHEIALRGVPNRSGAPLELIGLDQEIKDLAGLVARSHGMSIRSTFSYIEDRYGLIPEHRRIKTPFLMAVLRIADYVQVQSERALKSLLSVKELRSPVSRQEWRNHFAVRDVSVRHDDPEALYVHAAPTDVRTYLKLTALFKDIQRELDESWATIGEVYGRRGDLAALGLSWRRIRSNLDKTEQFARTVPYIPIKAGFDASGPDLLKLLVGPLYDYSYKVGIRELVQNAVDACRELADLSERELKNVNKPDENDVLVEFQESDDGTGWITVSDRGVGMTLDTVTKYFLIAGASFRNSDVWKRQHMDDRGRTRVLRGGRFGVGALAAFLLGEEIRVQTRHIDRADIDGLEFTARMDEPVVELRRCALPYGTSIRVWISDHRVFDALRPAVPSDVVNNGAVDSIKLEDWHAVDWFAQLTPRVKYVWSGFDIDKSHEYRTKIRIKAEFTPSPDEVVPSPNGPVGDWRVLPDPAPYATILWRYELKKGQRSGEVEDRLFPSEITVNGIRVQKIGRYDGRDAHIGIAEKGAEFGPKFALRRPSIAVFDPAGVCPINLQRSSIAFDRMGLDGRLADDILARHIEEVAAEARTCTSLLDLQKLCKKMTREEAVNYEGFVSPICATSLGITLNSVHLLSELGIRNLFFVDSPDAAPSLSFSSVLGDEDALFFRQRGGGIANDLTWFRGLFDPSYWYSPAAGLPRVSRREAISVMPRKKWLLASEKGKVNRQILESLDNKEHGDNFELVVSGEIKQADRLLARIDKFLDIFDENVEISVWSMREEQELSEQMPLLPRLWVSTVGGATFKLE